MSNDHKAELRKADILCIREQYDRAIDIYNQILDEDMECEEAYVGLLKAHSEYFTIFSGEQIDKDIRIIERLFPDIENEEYLTFLKKRKEARSSQKVAPTRVEERKETPVSTSSYRKEEPAQSFDIVVFGGRLTLFYEGTDEGYNTKQEAYFYSVMKNPNAPMSNRVQAAYAAGYCYYRREIYFMAHSCFEFAIENIKYHKYNNGDVFEKMGWLYIYGAGTIPMDKEKAKQYWLRGRDEYNNKECRELLKIKFGI